MARRQRRRAHGHDGPAPDDTLFNDRVQILREGLVITGWVAMWRPLEVLLYDWWPMVDERRQVRRILAAPVSIRYEGTTQSADERRDVTAEPNMMDPSPLPGVASQTT